MSSCGCFACLFQSQRDSQSKKVSAPAVRVQDVVGNRPLKCGLHFVGPEGLAAAQSFHAEPGDVFISTFPKTGTTWMQQICHQLRTGGHTEFEEISEEGVVPWLEAGPSIDIDVTLPQIAQPRCFKSHQRLSALSHLDSEGGKFLCVLREPEATLKSYFKFLLAKNRPVTASKDVNDFIRSEFIMAIDNGGYGGNIWQFYTEYWSCRQLPSVKVVAYEHLRKDTAKQLRGISAFLGIADLDDKRLSKVLELTSMQWMSENNRLFDDHHVGVRLSKKMAAKGKGEGKGKAAPKSVAVKKVGHEIKDDSVITELTPETKELLAQAWMERMKPVTGCDSYLEMIAEL